MFGLKQRRQEVAREAEDGRNRQATAERRQAWEQDRRNRGLPIDAITADEATDAIVDVIKRMADSKDEYDETDGCGTCWDTILDVPTGIRMSANLFVETFNRVLRNADSAYQVEIKRYPGAHWYVRRFREDRVIASLEEMVTKRIQEIEKG